MSVSVKCQGPVQSDRRHGWKLNEWRMPEIVSSMESFSLKCNWLMSYFYERRSGQMRKRTRISRKWDGTRYWGQVVSERGTNFKNNVLLQTDWYGEWATHFYPDRDQILKWERSWSNKSLINYRMKFECKRGTEMKVLLRGARLLDLCHSARRCLVLSARGGVRWDWLRMQWWHWDDGSKIGWQDRMWQQN